MLPSSTATALPSVTSPSTQSGALPGIATGAVAGPEPGPSSIGPSLGLGPSSSSSLGPGPGPGPSSSLGPGPSPGPGPPTGSGPGTKRPAASEIQPPPGTTPKRHAGMGSRASISGPPPQINPTPPVPPSAYGQPGPSPTGHARSRSHATAASAPMGSPTAPAHIPPPQPQYHPSPFQAQHSGLTEDQLVGRSTEQLVNTILQIQSQNQQIVSQLATQYDSISQQLHDLRASLTSFYGGQVTTSQAAISALTPREPSSATSGRQMYGPPAFPPQQSGTVVQTPRPSTSHSRNGSTRILPTSPPSQPDIRLLPKPSAQAPQAPGPPAYDYRTVATVEEVWKEYREGMDGQPAIEDLDATWGSRWRPEPRGRTWYSRRKVIWDKIKEYIEAGLGEEEAVRKVEDLRDGGTINKLIRMLQEEKKDKGVGDDSMNA